MGKTKWQTIGKSALLSLLIVLISAPASSAESETLSTKLEQFLLSKPGAYSVTALEIAGGAREVQLHESTQVDPASIFKLYYAGLAFEKIQSGKWSLSTKLASNYSVQTCLKMMISFSDNECAVDLRQKLGIKFINSRLLEFGLANSHVVTNANGEYLTKHTTTADVAKFLKLLQSGELLDSTQTARFRNLLKGQVWRARISSALPVGTVVGSKSGQLLTNTGMIEGDSAIVFGPSSTYVLVVIGRSGATGAAVRGVSDLVYREWQGNIPTRAKYPSAQLVAKAATYLRSKPGGAVIKRIGSGTQVTLEWSERGWLYVKAGDRRGYIYQSSVQLSNRYLHWGSP